MQIRLIEKITEVDLKYQQISGKNQFKFEDRSEDLPFSIINETPWTMGITCPQCKNEAIIANYNPLIGIKKPIQSNFLRLAPCYSKFYSETDLMTLQSIFQGSHLISEDEKHFLLHTKESKYLKSNSINIAYSTCNKCGQEYLTSYKFDYPNNERKKNPDPVLCHIKELIRVDFYFDEGQSINDFVILKNRD